MKNMIKTPVPTKPSSTKTRFAVKFLQAMKKLNNRTSVPSTAAATKNKYKRYRFVRAAACASMASAVGPRRAWSRAVLRKIRNRTSLYNSLIMNKSRSTTRSPRRRRHRRRLIKHGLMLRGNYPARQDLEIKEDDLRGLVPGGDFMDFPVLLSETAHYIKCLRDQVQVMTNILNHYSA